MKLLLADTIGRSLYLCQNRLPGSSHQHVLDTRSAVLTGDPPSPRWSISTDQHQPHRRMPSSTSTSSGTLTVESNRIEPNNTSDTLVRSGLNNSSYTNSKPSSCNRIVSLSGTALEQDVERLTTDYGLPSQMGLLDPSYHLFINDQGTAALCFKVLNNVAVIMGDPMCELDQIPSLLKDFKHYRRRKRWGMCIIGAGGEFARYAAATKKWTVMQFGNNRILNPLTNEIIHEKWGKRMLTQNRQLLNPSKGGIVVEIYTPSLHGADFQLESQLGAIYNEWRIARNASSKPHAFITEYDPFIMPYLMTFIYSRDPDGTINGFTGLRWVGAKAGYHVDPCIAAPGARRGISDLLLFASMAYARQLGISYLSVGYEPSESLAELFGMPAAIARLIDRVYQYTFQHFTFGAKRAYFEKFKPDSEQDSPVYVIFPSKIPKPRPIIAVAHVANISIRQLLFGHRAKS